MDEIKGLIMRLRASRHGASVLGDFLCNEGKNRARPFDEAFNTAARPIWDLEEKAAFWSGADVPPSPVVASLAAVPNPTRRVGDLRGKKCHPIPDEARRLGLAWLDEWQSLLREAAKHTPRATAELKRADRLRELLQ